jgi:hypothetical protein
MPEHDFSGISDRCVHCGTLKTHHENVPQPCVPQWSKEPLRPEPARHEYASEAFDDIGKRLAELAAERTAAMNIPPKD